MFGDVPEIQAGHSRLVEPMSSLFGTDSNTSQDCQTRGMRCCWLPIIALMLFASCKSPLGPPAYPRVVAGDYRLYRENILVGEQIPKEIPPSGLIRAVQLVYDASNGIQLTVAEMKNSTVAWQAMQSWRSQPYGGDQAVQTGCYFVIAQGEKPDPARIAAFLADFKKQLK